jgi:hypothetical protein
MILNPTHIATNEYGTVTGVSFVTSQGTLHLVGRTRPSYGASVYDKNDYLARPRMFVSSTEVSEEMSETQANKIYRKGALALINDLGLPIRGFEANFSKSAASRDGSYAPAFILKVDGYKKHDTSSIRIEFTLPNGQSVRFDRFDLYIDLGYQAEMAA